MFVSSLVVAALVLISSRWEIPRVQALASFAPIVVRYSRHRTTRSHALPFLTRSLVLTGVAASGEEDGVVAGGNIKSPVLQQVYPLMLDYVDRYGHPNIPLKIEGGRQCVVLRRLHTQQKLADSDVELLDSLHFTWHSLEDVYEANKERFDEFLNKLKAYAEENEGVLSPPKKYPADPELGAWVTGIRRLKMADAVDPSHVKALDKLGFLWVSPRSCGSKFMLQYRDIQKRLSKIEEADAVWSDPAIVKWVYAQQQADLSGTRKHYMSQLLGPDWKEWKAETVDAQ